MFIPFKRYLPFSKEKERDGEAHRGWGLCKGRSHTAYALLTVHLQLARAGRFGLKIKSRFCYDFSGFL